MNISSLSPNIYVQILQTASKERLREFEKRSKHFSFGDHFINSHNLFS